MNNKGFLPVLTAPILLGAAIFVLLILFLSGAFLRFIVGASFVGVALYLLTKKKQPTKNLIITSWILIILGIILMVNPFDAFSFFNISGGI